MKRHMILGTVFSAALAVGVSAQSTGAQSTQPSSQKQSQQNQQVTVTGCLKDADMAGGGTAGTSGTTGQATKSSSSEAKFMLTDARVTGGSTGTAGTSGTATTGAAGASMNNKFLLMGGNQQDLEQYLNSEVEIRGTLQKQSASNRTGATGAGTGSMASGQSKTHENVPSIRVTSVKQTAKTCTSGN